MTRVGYRYLVTGDYPGAETHTTEQLDVPRSLSILIYPPDSGTEY